MQFAQVILRAPGECMTYVRFLASIIALLFAGPLLAQTANLEVVVLQQTSGKAIAAIGVTLENHAIGFRTTAATNAQGKVRFESLSTAGRYSVTVDDRGYEPVGAKEIELRSNFTRSVILTTSPRAALTAQIAVSADAGIARINTVNAEVSSSLKQEEVEALPAEGRDITRLLYRLPNVTQATGFYPEAPNVSINGANSLYAQYLIDGLDNNENFLGGQKFAIPIGFTREITVLTNNYSTEFGRTGNGVINVTTRSGNNKLDGEVFYLTRPGPSIDSKSPFAQRDLSGNAVKDGFRRSQYGFGIGGPIFRDRTFFFFDGELTKDHKDNLLRVPQPGVNQTVPGRNTFDYFSGKIDQRWSDSFTSSLRGNIGRVSIERQAGGLDGGVTFPSAANFQDRNSDLVALNNVWTSASLVPETNLLYSRFRWNYARPEPGAGPQVVVHDPAGETVAILGNPGFIFDDIEKTLQAQQKVTHALGRHTLKGGVELVSSDFALRGGGNVNGNYLVQLTPAQLDALRAGNLGANLGIHDIPGDVHVLDYNIELQPKSFGKRQNVYSAYAEDLFSVSTRLNVTAGLRYDYDNLSKGGASKGDTDNIAPRLSFNYQLSNRSSLRGGYGLFYDKIVYSVYSDALQQNSISPGFRSQIEQLMAKGILPSNTDLNRIFFDGNLSADYSSGVTYLNGPHPDPSQRTGISSYEMRILNPLGYANPYTQQISLGYQWQIDQKTLFYVDAIHNHAWNLYRLRANAISDRSEPRCRANAPTGERHPPCAAGAGRRSQHRRDRGQGPVPILRRNVQSRP
jgi:outer membrane receptor for ferrienterochelin and colicin